MKSILIVEDNEAIIKGLKYLLEQDMQNCWRYYECCRD